jgi:hypothetical protein
MADLCHEVTGVEEVGLSFTFLLDFDVTDI